VGRVEVIVADTHTLIWWILEPERLSPSALGAIGSADVIGFAAISCWEVGMLPQRRRVAFDLEPAAWLHGIVDARNVSILPITIEIGVLAAELQDVLRDPIDCLNRRHRPHPQRPARYQRRPYPAKRRCRNDLVTTPPPTPSRTSPANMP
jgi:PIN domain nuclease of toxin-antitoxin system